jgi:hypothetical protein
MKVIVTSGTFAGGDAAGTLLLANQSGTFQAETIKVGANLNVANIAGNTSNIGWQKQLYLQSLYDQQACICHFHQTLAFYL